MWRFWSDRKGNVALLFALAMIPIFGAMGSALDYSMAAAYRTDMQKALDATALALTKIMPADQATLDTVGNQYFQASMGANSLTNLQLVVTPELGLLKVSVSATYKAHMASLIGASTVDLGARSETRWSIGKVEIALALDNSLSMNELGRMTHLKAAAHDLLNILENAVQNEDDAKIAIIPFDGHIRVVTSANSTWRTNNSDWVRWDLWDANNGTCSNPSGADTQIKCGTCSKSWLNSQTTCQSGGGNWTPATWTPKSRSNWNGCVQDRDKDPAVNYDVNDEQPSSNESKYPAWQCFSSPTKLTTIMPLSTNWGASESADATTLHGKVNAMTPNGYTNATIGLVWAFHALSSTPRLTEGAAYDTENLTKYIILLSDGDNTCNRWESSCTVGVPHPNVDARTTAVCASIKAEGIKIYTIRLIDGNAALLQACASKPGMYKEVQQASDLSSVFNAIGSEIANLHLSK